MEGEVQNIPSSNCPFTGAIEKCVRDRAGDLSSNGQLVPGFCCAAWYHLCARCKMPSIDAN